MTCGELRLAKNNGKEERFQIGFAGTQMVNGAVWPRSN
jgi:hypothetical protein